jgi:hypothetical protein
VPRTVAHDVTEVTWSFLTVAPSSVTTQPSNARCGERGREGRKDVAVLRYCYAIAFLEVSEFQQLPHGAITPHYIYTGFHRRNVPYFGRVFLMLKYTDITQNTYVQS